MADHVFDDANSLFDFVAKKGNGVKGLVDLGIAEVPQIYIQPAHERFENINQSSISDQHLSSSSVPIDLSKLDGPQHDKVAEAIVRAAETLGFFQVINHGVDLEVLESLKDAAHRFFARPGDAKAIYLKGNSPSPLVRYTTSFAPEKEKVLEWRDHVSIVYTNDDDAEKYWPTDCKRELLDYMKLSYKIVRRLFEILIENLGVKLEDSRLESLIGLKVVNMNFYPPCPNPKLTIGTGRHSDIGILTVLLQDEIGGLYVKIEEDIQAGRKEEWIKIPPISDALVINIGDSLQILSNGRYKSAEHKAYTTNKQSRVSIPLFIAPRPAEKIGPLPQQVKRDGRALYREIVYQDYRNNFLGLAHDGKQALDFAKITYPN